MRLLMPARHLRDTPLESLADVLLAALPAALQEEQDDDLLAGAAAGATW